TPSPALEVRVHVGRAVLHRVSVDRCLEVVRQHALDLGAAVPSLDLGGDVLPKHNLIMGHLSVPIEERPDELAGVELLTCRAHFVRAAEWFAAWPGMRTALACV